MATDAGWGRRLRAARRAYEERHDCSLTYREIGERVGVRMGREPFAHPTVRAWFVNGQEPDSFAVAIVLADVLEEDAGQLITGKDTKTPASPETGVTTFDPNPELDTKVTDEEHAADEAAFQAREASRKRKIPRRA